jgi:hypothetical protein
MAIDVLSVKTPMALKQMRVIINKCLLKGVSLRFL